MARFFTATSTAATSTFPYLTSAQIAITGLSAGSIPFIGAGGILSQNNSNLFWDNTNYRLGVGTTTPSAKLDVVGNANITGDLNIASGKYITYNSENFAMANTSLYDYFSGGAGNLTMSGGYNTAMGYQAMLNTTTAQSSVAIGYQAMLNTTTNGGSVAIGYQAGKDDNGGANIAIGWRAMYAANTGGSNVAIGTEALSNNTTGDRNIALGISALKFNTTGTDNVALGNNALNVSSTAGYNTAVGYRSLSYTTTGASNAALGWHAGRYITGGSTANQTSNTSVYLGAETKASANGNANEIVVGYNSTGNGSNTVTLGNDSITTTYLKGDIKKNGKGIPYVLAYQHSQVYSHTGNVNETTMATITVPGGTLSANGVLEIYLLWSFTGSTNTKTMRTKFGGTTFVAAVQSTTINVAQAQSIRIQNRNATNSQIGPPGNQTGGIGSGAASITASIDTTTNQDIVITGQLANSGETIALEAYAIEVINP